MTTSVPNRRASRPRKLPEPTAAYVVVSDSTLSVTLGDDRVLSVPLEWYPRLSHGTPAERNHWELIGGGTAIHWPDLNEGVSIEGLVAGRRSMESPKSFKRWLRFRDRGEQVPIPTFP